MNTTVLQVIKFDEDNLYTGFEKDFDLPHPPNKDVVYTDRVRFGDDYMEKAFSIEDITYDIEKDNYFVRARNYVTFAKRKDVQHDYERSGWRTVFGGG